MKQIRFILLALTCTLLLAACERPAPAGEIPVPGENSPEIVPRTEEAYPTTPTDATTTDPTVAAPETPSDNSTTDNTADQPTEGDTTAPVENTEPAATEEEADEAPALEDGVYVVKSGDTLGQIAFIYGISVEDIMAANNLTNADVLDVGQELIIPEAGFAETQTTTDEDTTADTDEPATDSTGAEQTYVVKAGDNLYRIGLQFGFTVDELAEYNNLTNVNSLEVGQTIKIPPSN